MNYDIDGQFIASNSPFILPGTVTFSSLGRRRRLVFVYCRYMYAVGSHVTIGNGTPSSAN